MATDSVVRLVIWSVTSTARPETHGDSSPGSGVITSVMPALISNTVSMTPSFDVFPRRSGLILGAEPTQGTFPRMFSLRRGRRQSPNTESGATEKYPTTRTESASSPDAPSHSPPTPTRDRASVTPNWPTRRSELASLATRVPGSSSQGLPTSYWCWEQGAGRYVASKVRAGRPLSSTPGSPAWYVPSSGINPGRRKKTRSVVDAPSAPRFRRVTSAER